MGEMFYGLVKLAVTQHYACGLVVNIPCDQALQFLKTGPEAILGAVENFITGQRAYGMINIHKFVFNQPRIVFIHSSSSAKTVVLLTFPTGWISLMILNPAISSG